MEKTAALEAYGRYRQKQAREFMTNEGIPVDAALSEYANKVRNYELGGTGIGAALGAGLIGTLSKGRLPGIAMGAVGGGLLGKGLGRSTGEDLGLRSLESQTGVPLERDPTSAIVQR